MVSELKEAQNARVTLKATESLTYECSEGMLLKELNTKLNRLCANDAKTWHAHKVPMTRQLQRYLLYTQQLTGGAALRFGTCRNSRSITKVTLELFV